MLFEKSENPIDIRDFKLSKSLLVGDGWKRERFTGQRVPSLSWKFESDIRPSDPRTTSEAYFEQ